jgi:hypothetical protein
MLGVFVLSPPLPVMCCGDGLGLLVADNDLVRMPGFPRKKLNRMGPWDVFTQAMVLGSFRSKEVMRGNARLHAAVSCMVN